MFDLIRRRTQRLIDKWRTEVQDRRTRAGAATDPGAELLESCAKDVEQMLKEITEDTSILTADDYKDLHGVTVQTVRNWCRAGLLAGAYQDARGQWHIPRDAQAPNLRVAS